ncbi:hypothetical protein Tco_0825065 [Tanacetum coccineum]
MDTRVCSYRKWELTRIPCKHVVAVIYNMSKNLMGSAYRLETWAHVYSFKVNPCNGREMWLVVEFTTVIIPHLYKPQVGRPLKKRKKSHDEIASKSCSSGKLSRKGNQAGGSSQAGAKNVSGEAVGVKNASSQSDGSSQPSATQSTTTGVRNASSQAAGASQPSASPSIASQRPTQHRNTTGINVTEKIDKVEQEREKQDKEDNKKTSVEVTDNNRGEKNFVDVANAARLNNSLMTIPTMLKDDGNDVVRILQKSQEKGQNRTNTDTGMEKSVQELEECFQSQPLVNSWSTKGKSKLATWLNNSSNKEQAGRVLHYQTLSLVKTHKENATQMKETHQGLDFCTKVRTKEAQEGQITDCHAGNLCAHQNNLRAKNRAPMIGKIQEQGFMGASNKLQVLEASLKAINSPHIHTHGISSFSF